MKFDIPRLSLCDSTKPENIQSEMSIERKSHRRETDKAWKRGYLK